MRPFATLLFVAGCVSATTSTPGPHTPVQAAPASTPDEADIKDVLAAFTRAIPAHDGTALSALMVNPEVPFRSQVVGKTDTRTSTAGEFATEVAATKQTWSEAMTNVVVTVRHGLAVLDADYTFSVDGTQTNHGHEVWTLFRIDGHWKIATVTWSVIVDKA